MKQHLLFVGAFLFASVSSNAQKAPFISNGVPQIPVESRIAVPMPEKAIDGFNEIPKNPLNLLFLQLLSTYSLENLL